MRPRTVSFTQNVDVDVEVEMTEEELNDLGWHRVESDHASLVDHAAGIARAVLEEHMERHGKFAPHLCSEGVCGRLNYDAMSALREVHPHA